MTLGWPDTRTVSKSICLTLPHPCVYLGLLSNPKESLCFYGSFYGIREHDDAVLNLHNDSRQMGLRQFTVRGGGCPPLAQG